MVSLKNIKCAFMNFSALDKVKKITHHSYTAPLLGKLSSLCLQSFFLSSICDFFVFLKGGQLYLLKKQI